MKKTRTKSQRERRRERRGRRRKPSIRLSLEWNILYTRVVTAKSNNLLHLVIEVIFIHLCGFRVEIRLVWYYCYFAVVVVVLFLCKCVFLACAHTHIEHHAIHWLSFIHSLLFFFLRCAMSYKFVLFHTMRPGTIRHDGMKRIFPIVVKWIFLQNKWPMVTHSFSNRLAEFMCRFKNTIECKPKLAAFS